MRSLFSSCIRFARSRMAPDREDSSSQLTWDSALMLLGNGFISFLFLLFHVLSGRLLDGESYAEVVAMIGLLNVLNVPAGVIQLTISRYVAELGWKDDNRTWLWIVVNGMRTVTRWGLPALLLWGLLSFPLQQQMDVQSITSLWMCGLAAFVFLYTPILGGALQGRHLFGWFILSGLGVGLSRLLFAGTVLPLKQGAPGMLFAVAASFAVGLVISWLPLRSSGNKEALPSPDLDVAEIRRYFLGVLLGQGALYLLIHADLIFMPRLLEGEALDAYSKAATVARIVFFLPLPIMIAMFPRAVVSQKPSILLIPVLGTLVAALGAALVMNVIPELFMGLIYGEATELQVKLVRVYAWAAIPFALNSILSPYLWARREVGLTLLLLPVTALYVALLWMRSWTAEELIRLVFLAGLVSFALLLCFTWRSLASSKQS